MLDQDDEEVHEYVREQEDDNHHPSARAQGKDKNNNRSMKLYCMDSIHTLPSPFIQSILF